MCARQRLVVCLDGTWNKEDDSTNVLHHFNLVQEDFCANDAGGGIVQKKKYFRGVGTGVLDRFTGGGFGLGIEENVREAYNWLVQNYNDGGEYAEQADEIFIFGFSRGAYTARSLVGFISRCGLLRKGAPFTVNELWKEYGILQREHEDRPPSFWTNLFGEDRPDDRDPLRDITKLVCDPWLKDGARDEMTERLKPARSEREQRFKESSRRAQITFLGVYDTVGALGLDALAIPGLRSQMANHHNMRPSTIIRKCRHALALDEHRSNFAHTPFVAYIGQDSEEELQRGEGAAKGNHTFASEFFNFWGGRIEQCWFTGAHANIGGGYPNNMLAQAPLRWILEGAKLCNLRCDPFDPATPRQEAPKDSYAEFARPFWALLIRDKRNYRRLVPEGERRAYFTPDPGKKGFELKSINERVHPSVNQHYPKEDFPPNLVHYYAQLDEAGSLKVPMPKRPHHDWLRGGAPEWIVLILWACAGVAGVASFVQMFSGAVLSLPVACLLAALFPLLDWYESHANFKLALDGPSPFRRARRDCLYWLRGFCFALVVCGALRIAGDCLRWGWHMNWAKVAGTGTWLRTQLRGGDIWKPRLTLLVPSMMLAAGAAIAGVKLFKDGFHPNLEARKVRWIWAWRFASAPALVAALAMLVHRIMPELASGLRQLANAVFGDFADDLWQEAGALLALELGFLLCLNAWFVWVEQPLRRANLVSLKRLRCRFTKSGIEKQFSGWCRQLDSGYRELDHDAGKYMGKCAHEALSRDMLGFVPLYASVLGFALWFGARDLSSTMGIGRWLLQPGLSVAGWSIPVWVFVTAAVALINLALDRCHLAYLKCDGVAHRTPKQLPPVLPAITFMLTLGWWAAFPAAMLGCAAAVLRGNWEVIRADTRGGLPSLIVTLLAVAVGLLLLVLAKGVASELYRKHAHEKPVNENPPLAEKAAAATVSAGGTGAIPN